jgi:hypothetical protein
MSATNYTSKNILWSFITSLADGDFVSMARLYEEGLQRLHDGQGALLGRIAKVYADLSSTTIGTKARIVGNVDMTSFNYNSGIALSGLTVIVDEDTAAAQTVTFDNTVTGPSVLLAQLTAQAPTNLIWSLNDSGQLVAESQTAGAGSTIALGAGTAHGLIWPSPTITSPGSGVDNDGSTHIGFAQYTPPVGPSWGGGTLRDFGKALYALAAATATNALLKTGGTMTGNIAFTSPAKVVYNATYSRRSRGHWTSASANLRWVFLGLNSPSHSSIGAAETIEHDLDVMPGDVLDGVDVWSHHDGVVHGALPATMPTTTMQQLQMH